MSSSPGALGVVFERGRPAFQRRHRAGFRSSRRKRETASDCAALIVVDGQVDRLIGSIRRESLDHMMMFDEAQLGRVLKNYAFYL